MPMSIRQILLGLVAGLAVWPALAAVEVSFTNRDRYVDVNRFDEFDTVLYGIEQHLKALGDRYLPPGQVLKIEIVDIDLAGRRDLVRGRPREVRIVRQAEWPSINLRYTLEEQGRALASGRETVADMDYLQRINAYPAGDSLRYEKRMLDAWFKERFVARRAAR